MATNPVSPAIPDSLITRQQLRKLRSEVETIHEQAVQGSIRKEQTGAAFGVNKPSQLLSEMMELHKLTLTIDSLQKLITILEDIDKRAVNLRVVLSAEADANVSRKLVNWFRKELDQPVMLRLGIQPAIAGGCIVYTPNHRYDFTLRTKIKQSNVQLRSIMDKIA